jgi:hypothetical protein
MPSWNDCLSPLLAFSLGPFGSAELLVIFVLLAVPLMGSIALIWLILKLTKKRSEIPPVLPRDPETKDS